MGESVTGYWLEQALGGAPLETEALEGDARADVAILGGGFTGLWTALRLKALEPALDVAVVEKNFCGSGASGRNGGFCMTWASKIHTLVKLCGAQEGLRLYRATDEAVGAIGAFCNEYGIDAEFRQDGWLWTASNPAQLDAWMPCLDQLERLGANPFQILDAEEAARRGGAPVIQAGVYEPSPRSPACNRAGSPSACAGWRSKRACGSTSARRSPGSSVARARASRPLAAAWSQTSWYSPSTPGPPSCGSSG
jgi:hypothetical protein